MSIFTVDGGNADKRADLFVSEVCNITRSTAQRLILEEAVTVNGMKIEKNRKMRCGDTVTVILPPIKETETEAEELPLDIIYEDGDIAVINKPCGMVVHPAPGNESGTLVNALLYHMGDRLSGIGGERRPGIVHRIDKDTSGLLVIAKNDFAHNILSEGLKTHSIDREYKAVVIGNMKNDFGTVDKNLGRCPKDRKKQAVVADGRHAVTHYTVCERYRGFTLIDAKLETGRTHQIRVHMASIGHPLLGDTLYGGGGTKFEKQNKELIQGQTLHAFRLTLTHPRTGCVMSFECPLPEYFEKILEKLRRQSAD